MPRQKQSNPKALKQQREEVKLLLKDGQSSTTQESGTEKHSPSGSKGKSNSRRDAGEKNSKYKNAMKVKIAEKVKNKRMARALREKKSSDRKVSQLQDKGNNNMLITTKEPDINEKIIEKFSEPAKKDKYDLIKERSARTTKQAQPKENSPKKIKPSGQQKISMLQKGNQGVPQDTGQHIDKASDEDKPVDNPQKDIEQEAADKQQALEALLHISGVELDSFTQEQKEPKLPESQEKSVENQSLPSVKEQSISKSSGPETTTSSEAHNMVLIDETEIGVKYQLKSDSLEEQGLKLTYTAPTAADFDLNPVSYGVYRPNRSKPVVSQQDTEYVDFDKDKGKGVGKHVCEFCGRRCLKPSVLKKHIRSHTGERPYPCIPCGFSFKTKSNLYKHRKSHAHAIKAGITSNLEGIKVIDDYENDSEETESEDEMEIDEGFDTVNNLEIEERLKGTETTGKDEEAQYFRRISKPGVPGQTSVFSGDALHTPATTGRYLHRFRKEFSSSTETRLIQDGNNVNTGGTVPMNESDGVATKSIISHTSLSQVINKGSKGDSDTLLREQSSQADTGCGKVLENLRSKDVAGFRIDMETGRAMPILHTQQTEGVMENHEMKVDEKKTKNDTDPAKLMIPLTNFSIVKSGGQFHVQIPVQGILESAIVKESENLLTTQADKSKTVDVCQEKLESIDFKRKNRRTVSETIASDSVQKPHLSLLPVEDLLKLSRSNRTSVTVESHEKPDQLQQQSSKYENILLKKVTAQTDLTHNEQVTPISVVSSQTAPLSSFPNSFPGSNKMIWTQSKNQLASPRKTSTSTPVVHFSQSITELQNTRKEVEDVQKKSPYSFYPVVTVSHDKPSVGLVAEKYTFLPQPSISPVSQQNPAHSPNYSRYKTLEETQAALRAAQPKLFKRRKYKSEGDTMPSDLNLPKKRGRKLKHERTVVDRVPTPTRPMAPVPFLPTLPPVPQSPLTISTAAIPRTAPMLSSLHFAKLPSLEPDRHSMISPSGSVIHIPNSIGITSSGSRTRNTNQVIAPTQFVGTSTSVHPNTTTVPFSLVQNVPYSSTVLSTSLDTRKHGAASKVQDFVNEHKNRSEGHAYHPVSLPVQSPFPGPPGPSNAWTKRHMNVSPKTKDHDRPRPLMPISDVTHEVSIEDSGDNQSRIKMESSVSSDLKQPLARPGFLKTPDNFGQIRPSSKPSRKNLTLDIPSFGSLKQPAVTKAGKCTTPIEFAAKTLLSPEAFSIAQSVVKLASPMKTKPDGTPTTPVEAARELGRLAAHAAFANAGGKVENILSPMIPSIATSQGSIVVGPITTPTTSGPQKQFFVLPSPSKGHIPGFPSQYDNQLIKKQVPVTTVETLLSVGTPVNVETPVQTTPKPSSAYPPNPASSQMMSPKLRTQPVPALSSAVIQQTEFTPLMNKPIQNHSTHGQTIAFIHGLPTYQAKTRLRTSALDKINETVITNEGFKTYPTPLKYLYKNANGNHSITTPMFTCLYRTQPMYVKQHSNNKVSMYSNWRSGCNSLHPLGISWKAHLGLNDSSRNHRPRMIYMVSSLSKDQGGILTHSSMWRREDPRTLANQKNIPTIKQQHQTNSSSRGEINANFPHKLFRHGRTHHRRTESESAVIDCKTKERKMKDLGKHEPLRVPIFEGGFKSNEEYVYVRGRGRGKYVCEECGIRCKKPSMLKKHIRTHTDMRPYKCSICNFAFKTKGNLTKHMKSKAHNKKTVSTGDDAEPGSLEEDDDKIEEDDYDNDHQFSDADENEDTDSAEGETSDDDEDDDDDGDARFPDHSLLRRKRSHGSLPDISGFVGSTSDYHFSSIDAGSLPSLHSTRADQNLSDSLENISAKRTLKRAHSESLDKVRREKSDTLSDSFKSSNFSHVNCIGDSGKTEERKPTRSEVVGKLTQHLTNKNLEKLRAQTQSQPLITSLNNDNTKSFDISQLPLPQTGPGILPIPTFQPTYGLSVMNINSGFASSGDSIPMSSNYRISARIHEASKPENNTDKEGKSEKKQDVVRENIALPSHTTNSRESTETKMHSDTTLTTMPTEKISGVGSVFIPVSSVLQCGLIPPTTAPYSSGQFVFTFPMPSSGVTESDVVLPIHHPRVQNVPATMPSGKPTDDSSKQERISASQENNEKTHGFHKMPFSAIVSKRKRIEAHDRVSTVLTQLEHTPADDTFKRMKSSEINYELQQNTRTGQPKSYQCVQAPQAQFMPPSLPVAQSDVSIITSHHSPVLSSPYISGISSIPLVSPMTPSRMSQLPSTILATPEINKTGIQQQSETFIQKDKTMVPTSSLATVSAEGSKLSDSVHRRVIDIDHSDVDGIPSPTATRGGFHKCNVCLKDFTKPSQLRIHMRTHADEHPYSCEECSLSFRTRGLLQKHERSPVHFSHVDAVELSTENSDDPRPFKCKECSIAFRIPGHLAKHLRSKGHIMAMERQGKLARHRQDLGIIDGLQPKVDGDHEDENTDSASEGETEKVVVEEVKQVEYVHRADQSD